MRRSPLAPSFAPSPALAPALLLALGLASLGAGSAEAARSALPRLPSAVAAATPGTGSAPILSAGLDAGAAIEAVVRRRPARRVRPARRAAAVGLPRR